MFKFVVESVQQCYILRPSSWLPNRHEFLIYNTLYMSNQFSTMFRTDISGTKIIKYINKRTSATLVITLSSPSIYPGLKRVWVWTGIHFLDIFLGWLKRNSLTCSFIGHKNITRNTIIFKSSLRCCQNLSSRSRSQVKIWLPIYPAYSSASLISFPQNVLT